LFNSHEKSNTHHLEEPPNILMSWRQFISFHSVTYHVSLALYWKKKIFYVFRTISVCMAIFLMELSLQIFSTGTFYIYIYWNTVRGRQTASTHIDDGIWEFITPSHWEFITPSHWEFITPSHWEFITTSHWEFITPSHWEFITPSHWEFMRWNILRLNTVIVCHNTYHSNSNSIVCCLEMLQTNN
jgi:hypothetical protein